MNPLRENPDGSYSMDFDNLEKVADEKCRMLILSNPHNPAGILWDAETLRRLADFCYKHNIIVISDEIHSDMALSTVAASAFRMKNSWISLLTVPGWLLMTVRCSGPEARVS